MTDAPGHIGIDLQGADWSRVLVVMERLAASDDLGEILGLIIDSMRDCLGAERASVFEYDRERQELFAHKGHGVDRSLRFSAGLGIAGEAIRTGKIVNVGDCYADSRFNAEVDRQTGFRTRCMLTVPLVSYGGWLEGVAQVLNKRGGGPGGAGSASQAVFDERDEMMARALASQAAVALRRAHLLAAERRKNKMEADLRIAREVQLATLPVSLPRVAGYDIAALTRPAEETGGDTYDAALIERESGPAAAFLLMADASGHGVGPAMSVSRVQAMMRVALGLGVPLGAALERVNAHLHETLPVGRFVAAFAGVLDPASHRVECIAAGLAPVVVLRADGSFEERPADTYPLGIDARFEVQGVGVVELGPGDSLVVLSDGVYELMPGGAGGAGTEGRAGRRTADAFGVARVVEAARRGVGGAAPASGALAAVMEAAAAFGGQGPPADDQTGLIVTRMR